MREPYENKSFPRFENRAMEIHISPMKMKRDITEIVNPRSVSIGKQMFSERGIQDTETIWKQTNGLRILEAAFSKCMFPQWKWDGIL